MRMERKWTPAQKSAIDTRDCNVLVSAAAGSGKTAVLVERIISMITDPDKNIDIDRLVVVTFTKAAAAQMKDKIRKALDSMLDENPGDVNLLRQITLLNNAQITTIDSFCLWIIRNHFPEVNLDPGFRIMDEGEKKLIEMMYWKMCLRNSMPKQMKNSLILLMHLAWDGTIQGL